MRLGMELLEPVEFLARSQQLDRLAGDRPHGQGRAAAPIAVDARQHDAADADLLIEALGEPHRILAGERIGHEQRLMRLGDIAYRLGLGHQLFIDMQPARGIEHHDVIARRASPRHRPPGDGERIFRP